MLFLTKGKGAALGGSERPVSVGVSGYGVPLSRGGVGGIQPVDSEALFNSIIF